MSLRKLSTTLLICAPLMAYGQRNLKEIPNPDPAVQQSAFQLAPEIELNLWASDPMIAKPIQMAWDAKGRLWVASSAIYPQVKPGSTADDKILIVEDTNGDGKADKSTVFYDGLLIPTGVWPVIDATLPAGSAGRYNAAYVANSTEVLLLRDTNGDGKADDKQVVLSGFGTEDTHHIIHSFKGGPDGALYIAQSVYIHSHVETPFGTRRMLGSGIWQYRTETGQLEMFTLGQVNPWGLIWDRWGQSFTTDGAYGEGINFAWPGATFINLPNQRPRIMKGLNAGQPKHCGLEIINSRNFTGNWAGSLVTNDFRGHRVNRFVLQEDGSGFASKQVEDVVTTRHGSFRPVDVRMGSDGGLYLADWYNPIIQHGEVDFRDERRDKVHGRIWRVTMKGNPLAKVPDYEKLSIPQLLALLREPEDQPRYWSKQELKTRNPQEVIAALTAAVAQAPTNEAETQERVELLWTAETLGTSPELAQKIAEQCFASTDGRARAAAVRFLRNRALTEVATADALAKPNKPNPVTMAMLTKAIADSHARVRLEAINALRTVRTPQAIELALTALHQPVDVNHDYALWLTAWELADLWLPALQAGQITFAADPKQLEFALKSASHKPEAAGVLVKLIRENKIPQDKVSALLLFIAESGRADELTLLLEMAADSQKLPEEQRANLLNALGKAAKQRNMKPTGELNRVEELLTSKNAILQAAAARLAGNWKLESARQPLLTMAAAGETVGTVRLAMMEGLASLGDAANLVKLAREGSSPEIKVQAISALAPANPTAAAPEAPALLASLGADAALAGNVFDAFLKSTQGPQALAQALAGKKLSAEVAALGIQKSGSVGVDTKSLQAALTEAGALQAMAQQLTPEQMAQLVDEVKGKGNPARGEEVYRRTALACAACHAIGSAGGIIGPNMVSLGSSAPIDYIVESLLEPSKKIKEGYATTLVTLKNGEALTGFLSASDATQITLRDAAGAMRTVAKDQIAKQDNVPVSLMPPGLTGSLRRDEFVDLVRFLSELGKEGDYKIKGENTLRRWKVLNYSPTLNEVMNKDGFRALGKENPGYAWSPAYSKVNGELPIAEVPKFQVFIHKMSAVQTEIEVTSGGQVGLKINDTTAMKCFLGETEVSLKNNEATFELPAGKHTLTLSWDHTLRTNAALLAELVEPAGTKARFKPVGGP
jgi:putative heme-binding domain-containing protein